jgi:V-type H+-transporting ATPase subunit E
MTAFINQEAREKAREIEIKADEEFAIEKSKLVRQETDAIDAAYAKKFKQATMSQQITRSTVANKTRLKVLAARQELIDDIFEKAESKLMDQAKKDQGKYGETLKNLILEGMYALDEPDVVVRARKADYDLVKTAIEGASKEFKEAMGHESNATIDEENPVPEGRYVCSTCDGGPIFSTQKLISMMLTVLAACGLWVARARSRSTTLSRPGYRS